MENRQQQILSEIKSMMASIRSQLEMLDTKMAELQQVVDPEEFAAESVDIDIEVGEAVEPIPVDDDLPFGDVPEAEPVEAPAEVPAAVPVEEVPAEAPAIEDDDDLPAIFAEPEVVTVAEKAGVKAKPTVNDVMAADCAWMKDMPGPAVKDVRSAISLNDRVIFINLLFGEDAQAFVNALVRINALETLDQVVEYVSSEYPAWDMNSELVYRFMMAVRRKVR